VPVNPPTAEMGSKHEQYLAGLFGGAKTRASGSKWFDQGDVRNSHDEPFAFCVDGKSTLGKSITVTREMIAKIRQEAQGESPAFGLRWYGNTGLDQVDEDWAMLTGDALGSLLADARAWRGLADWLLADPPEGLSRDSDNEDVATFLRAAVARLAMTDSLRGQLREAHAALMDAGEAHAALRAEIDGLRAEREQPKEMAQWVPRLPWTVVHVQPQASGWWAGDVVGVSVRYQDDGTQVPSMVTSVRVQRSAVNRPHLFVDNVRVRNGDVYNAQGKLALRVCEDDASIEVEQGA
jgi:hypothetical protein